MFDVIYEQILNLAPDMIKYKKFKFQDWGCLNNRHLWPRILNRQFWIFHEQNKQKNV